MVYRDTNLQIIFAVALIAILRADSITPAFPDIARALHVSYQSVGLLITVFALPSVLLVPVLGVLADRWGRKRILVPSLMLFGLGGGACSLVRDFDLLLILRFLQGIGAASLSMLNITLIADIYTGGEQTAAMGYNASVRSVGSTLYPIVGGALATLGWYYPFVLSLLAIPVGVLVLFVLKSPEPKQGQRLTEYLGHAWTSFKNWEVVGLFVAGCVVFITMFGAYLAYFPFLLQETFGVDPFVIGLMVSGRSVVNAVIASQLGRLIKICAESVLLRASFVLYAVTFALIPLAPNLWTVAVLVVLLGTAEGLYWPSSHALLGKLSPMEHRAGFMAANDMALKLGQTVGPLLMGAVFGLWGVSGALYVAAGLSLATFALTSFLVGARRYART
jgi:MFS family permease